MLTDGPHLNGGFWSVVANLDVNTTGMFVAVWAAALACWRFGNIEAGGTAEVEK